MPGSHILVQAFYGISPCKFAEFLIHVVRSGAGVVSYPDAKVLDLEWLLFMNLITASESSMHRRQDDKERRKQKQKKVS